MPDAVKTRRFPPPWVIEDHNNACFIVKDANGFAVATSTMGKNPDGALKQKRTDYTVKKVETVAAGKDVPARLFSLAPGEVIPWQSHSEIADHFFVLGGELSVETRAPDDYRTLGIGERYQINAGHAHQTSNRGTRDCRFLIVQGVGDTTLKALAVLFVKPEKEKFLSAISHLLDVE